MNSFPVGRTATREQCFDLKVANRHGVIAGATGTGKTVTLQRLAECFSEAGINVFTADVKGDLAGLSLPGTLFEKIQKSLESLQYKGFSPHKNPVIFWDLYGKTGHPLRTTISAMGPLLLSRLLGLNDTQQGVLNAAFRFADDEGLLLLDLKDLQALLTWMSKQTADFKVKYGNLSVSSIAAIQRGLLSLEDAGGATFFGEPAFNIQDLFLKSEDGKGIINILDSTKLISDSRLYSTFLLWLLSELFEQLPEVGDLDKPKLVFFFDESHLFFKNAPKILIEKIEQVVRLIRSKGVGVYFVSQNALDIPESVLGQLGNRIQHAIRAFTPNDQKLVKAISASLRENTEFNTQEALLNLEIGEALISFLNNNGSPEMVERVKIYPPNSKMGAITEKERERIMEDSPLKGRYDVSIDRLSAYEKLNNLEHEKDETNSKSEKKTSQNRQRQTPLEAMLNSAARSLGSQAGKQIMRGIMGSIFGKRRP